MGDRMTLSEKQKERDRRISLKKELLKNIECSFCHNPIQELALSSDAEPRMINGKQACRECYYKKLGEAIERLPGETPEVICT